MLNLLSSSILSHFYSQIKTYLSTDHSHHRLFSLSSGLNSVFWLLSVLLKFVFFVLCFLPIFFLVYSTVCYFKLTMPVFEHSINIAYHIILYRTITRNFSRCWDSTTCKPLYDAKVQNSTFSHPLWYSSIECWITAYYNVGRLWHAGSQDTVVSCHMPTFALLHYVIKIHQRYRRRVIDEDDARCSF